MCQSAAYPVQQHRHGHATLPCLADASKTVACVWLQVPRGQRFPAVKDLLRNQHHWCCLYRGALQGSSAGPKESWQCQWCCS